MNALLENFPRWLALVTVAALGVAVVHEYGYFWIVGSHFQTVATTYDYLVNALLWLPSTTIMMLVVYGFKDFMTEPASYEWPKIPTFMIILAGGTFLVIGTITFVTGGKFAYETAYVLSAVAVYLGLAVYAFKYPHVPWETFRPVLFIPVILMFSFAYGSMSGERDLRKTDDVYFLARKGDNSSRAVVMLRSFEKGLLVRNHDLERTELVRWDDVASFWRFSTTKKEPSLACRWMRINCPTGMGHPI